MKYLNTYEERKYYRSRDVKYLNKENSKKLEDFIKDYIKNHMDKFIKRIEELDLEHFENEEYRLFEILNFVIIKGGYYFNYIDEFCEKNGIIDTIPAIRNSAQKSLSKIISETKLLDHIEQQLIHLFDENPEIYLWDIKIYNIPESVRKACAYIEESDKFNF